MPLGVDRRRQRDLGSIPPSYQICFEPLNSRGIRSASLGPSVIHNLWKITNSCVAHWGFGFRRRSTSVTVQLFTEPASVTMRRNDLENAESRGEHLKEVGARRQVEQCRRGKPHPTGDDQALWNMSHNGTHGASLTNDALIMLASVS
jgi:hypothetical protein